MNIQEILLWTTKHFESKKISSARLDAEVLLARVLDCERLDLYLKFDQPLSESDRASYKEMIKRRSAFEPVAYILGQKEFYGRGFFVGPGVLVPRPETEHIIDEATAHFKMESEKRMIDILDVATGSGCLAATLALELRVPRVEAVEISLEAARYAKKNFGSLKADVKLFEEDFLSWAESNKRQYDLIVSNPPYISKNANLMEDVKDFEPGQALFGGDRGYEKILSWMPHMFGMLKPKGIILCEIGSDQKEILQNEFQDYKPVFIKDYSGHDRIIKITK